MRMYIGNCTKQPHDFIYQVIGEKRPRKQRIEVLQQVRLTVELDPHQFNSIIEQHAVYGMVDVKNIDQTKAFTGLCYSDKEIQIHKLARAIEQNDGVLVKRGEEMRKEAAVATSNQLQKAAEGRLNSFEVSVTEDTKDGGAPRVNSGVKVLREGEGPAPDAAPRRRRRRAA